MVKESLSFKWAKLMIYINENCPWVMGIVFFVIGILVYYFSTIESFLNYSNFMFFKLSVIRYMSYFLILGGIYVFLKNILHKK